MTASTLLFTRRGALAIYHREGDTVPCPCRTPEGYRDPEWHKANPLYPECNAAGFIVQAVTSQVRAFIQPVSTGRALNNYITQMFGEIQSDDHIGMFPLTSVNGVILDFSNWSPATEEYIEYNGMRFTVVGFSLIPDPHDPQQNDHWEVALRRINKQEYGPTVGY